MDDDPWANAWGDQQPQLTQVNSLTTKPSSWSFAPHENSSDILQESDVGVPSWSTGVGVPWTDLSTPAHSRWEDQSASNFWKESSAVVTSPVTHPFPESKPHLPSPESPEPPPASQSFQPVSSPSSPGTTPDDGSDQSEFASHDQRADSPDAFGTFEEAVPDASWATAPVFSLDNPDWDPAWGVGAVPVPLKGEQPPDEWEAARMAKEERESRVLPEHLAAIVRRAEGFAEELWPTSDISKSDKTRLDERDLNLQRLEDVEGLEAAVAKLIPRDLTLPVIKFNKTTIAKKMTESIRQTKHSPISRLGPLSLSIVPKGSTAWEDAIKSAPDVPKDDVPPGWRIVEKQPEPLVASDASKASGKTISGFLSFLGRRATTPPSDKKPAGPPLPTPVSNVTAAPQGPPSSSVEKPKPVTNQTIPSRAVSPAPPPVAQPPQISNVSPSTTTEHDVARLDVKQNEAPSAITRFLGRLSRAKQGGPQPIKPLDLSSDDLEFLSEKGTNATDGMYKPINGMSDSFDLVSSSSSSSLPPPLPPLQTFQRASTPQAQADTTSRRAVQPAKVNGHTAQPHRQLGSSAPHPTVDLGRPSSGMTLTTAPGLTAGSFVLTDLPEAGPSHRSTPPSSNAILPPVSNKFPQAMMSKSATSKPLSNSVTFKLPPPPPSSRSQTPLIPPPHSQPVRSSTTTPIPRLPTPLSRSQVTQQFASVAMLSSSTTSQNNLDDFSEFHSPSVRTPMDFSMADASFSSTSSSRSLVSPTHQSKGHFDFDDFDDFVSSPIRTPSPPRRPAKPLAPVVKQLPLTPTVDSPNQALTIQQMRKASRAAEHSRTLSLVENAATRTGRWPTPPSPLPPALPPPGTTLNPFGVDLLGVQSPRRDHGPADKDLSPSRQTSASVFGDFSFHPTLSPPSGLRPSATPPPPQPHIMKPVAAVPQPMRLTATAVPASASAKPTGGLSAQDLSFFEGL